MPDTIETPPGDPAATDPNPPAEEQLGDAGKRALDAERAARAAAERTAKAAQAELDKIRKATQSEAEKAIEAAKEEVRAELTKQFQGQMIGSEIQRIAAGKLADPGDAPALLGDLSRFAMTDGTVDTKGIASAIDALLKAKPYLGAAGSQAKPLPGSANGKASTSQSINDMIRTAARGGR
ncbi:MAG: hypothetical protein AB7R77_12580 [Ilumatobacteraceae bacterium]